MQIRYKDKVDNGEDFGTCGCGRSPTGKCIGWHGLTEEAYRVKLSEYELDEYQRQAQALWGDSCTSGRAE